jgi:hypothetical protein
MDVANIRIVIGLFKKLWGHQLLESHHATTRRLRADATMSRSRFWLQWRAVMAREAARDGV